jgi:tRNA threonylcarbamoyladenosine biosynthesis protein TsaB
MIALAIDTATSSTSVALRLADGSMLSERDDPAPGEHPGHATRLLPMAAQLLQEAGIGWDALDRIAVGVGPGTFTGLRVGVSTARGLAQSLSVGLLGFSSLDALASGATSGELVTAERVLAVIDARRGEVFTALYERGPERRPLALAAPVAVDPAALGTLIGDGAGGVVAVGDGAVRYREDLERTGAHVPPDASALHLVSAASGCELAMAFPQATDGSLVPDYVRRPDAEIALAHGAGGQGR